MRSIARQAVPFFLVIGLIGDSCCSRAHGEPDGELQRPERDFFEKRIRPVLVYATTETLGLPLDAVDAAACAVELIHAYSLVHDDLPAMDDDDLRRGRPTCHKAFDEATAILAGDSLQVLAFKLLASHERLPARPAAAGPADVEVFLNDRAVGAFTVRGGFSEYRLAVPADVAADTAARAAPTVLRLQCTTWAPRDFLGGSDDRALGIMLDRIRVE